jgi:hypothetical protein
MAVMATIRTATPRRMGGFYGLPRADLPVLPPVLTARHHWS